MAQAAKMIDNTMGSGTEKIFTPRNAMPTGATLRRGRTMLSKARFMALRLGTEAILRDHKSLIIVPMMEPTTVPMAMPSSPSQLPKVQSATK